MGIQSAAGNLNATSGNGDSARPRAFGPRGDVPPPPRVPTFCAPLMEDDSDRKTIPVPRRPAVVPPLSEASTANTAVSRIEEEWYETPPRVTDHKELGRRQRQRIVLAAVAGLGGAIFMLAGLRLAFHAAGSAAIPRAARAETPTAARSVGPSP
jgi:hypothetical protein